MRARTTMIATTIVFLAGVVYLGVFIACPGFSAEEKPSRFEGSLARRPIEIARRQGRSSSKNPYPLTAESMRHRLGALG